MVSSIFSPGQSLNCRSHIRRVSRIRDSSGGRALLFVGCAFFFFFLVLVVVSPRIPFPRLWRAAAYRLVKRPRVLSLDRGRVARRRTRKRVPSGSILEKPQNAHALALCSGPGTRGPGELHWRPNNVSRSHPGKKKKAFDIADFARSRIN